MPDRGGASPSLNPQHASNLGHSPSLLLVDDDEAVLRTTRRALERRGFRVVAYARTADALRHLEQEAFDALISDVQMPELSGVHLLQAIRERDLEIPVVLMTGSPEVNSAASAIEYRAFDYLIKPVSPKQLHEVVERAIAANRQRYSAFMAAPGFSVQPIVLAATDVVYANEVSDIDVRILDPIQRATRRVARVIERASHDSAWLVNLPSKALLDVDLVEATAPLAQHAARVVFQFAERSALESLFDLCEPVRRLRALGFRVAIDKLGSGYATLSTLAVIEPDLVKLDAALVRNVDVSPKQQKVVSTLVSMCHTLGIPLVADGIETLAERATLVDLGCDLLQGPLIGRPCAADFGVD